MKPIEVTLKNGNIATIRQITKADMPALDDLDLALAQAGVGLICGPDELKPMTYKEGLGLWICAERESKILGALDLKIEEPRSLRHRALLGIGVHPNSQGTGVGKALMKVALDWAKQNGITRIELGVFASNTKAKKLYEGLGFVTEGIRKNFIRNENGTYDDDVLMAKLLE